VNPLYAALAAALVAAAAWRARALTTSGALAAAAVGFCHARVGVLGIAALLAFFATSTALSRIGKARKDALGYEKGATRDAGQVLANGGVAAAAALAWVALPDALWPKAALLGALAAANADTWATEIGSLWGGSPRRIVDLKPAAPGDSGAVSAVGTLAAALGAALVASVGIGLGPRTVAAAALAGLLGALFDSLLGATLQRQERCTVCGKATERAAHCGAPTRFARGWRWLGNDAVNAAATALGASVAALLA
jgi:uncharacterized protein (TIGR00297 family)